MKKYTSFVPALGLTAAIFMPTLHASSFFDELLGSGVSHSSSYSRPDQHSSTNGLSESKAQSYVKSLIRSLHQAFAPYMKKKTLQALEESIRHNALNSGTTYQWTSNGKRFSTDLIDQVVASLVLQWIEESAYKYAYKKNHDRTFAMQVATSLRNNALARIDSRGALAFDALVVFIGSSMEKEVDRLLAQQHSSSESYSSSNTYAPKPSAPAQFQTASYDFKTYPSTECAVCYEDLTNHTRVFLKPCGHDMCKNCASTWFFTNNKKSCPQCRSTVDRDHLSFALATL